MDSEHASALLGEIALDVPSTAESLPLVRSVVRSVVDFQSFDERSGYLVAVSEVFTNAVAAHERARVDDPVRIVIGVGDDSYVRVIDHGDGFPGAGDEALPRDEPGGAGRGLLIARAFVADLSIESSAFGTAVTLPIRSA